MPPVNLWPWTDTGTSSYNLTWVGWQSTNSWQPLNSSTIVWQQWTVNTNPVYSLPPTPPPTEEQRRNLDRVRELAAAKRAQCDRRARELLLSVLDEQQKEELKEHGWFHVHCEKGVYRLQPGCPPKKIIGDRPMFSYCIHPLSGFHADDVTASIKLMLDWSEVQFLTTANATRLANQLVSAA